MLSKLRRLLNAVGLLTGSGHPTSAEQRASSEIEIMSKADAIRLSGLSSGEWLQEVQRAVAAGAAMQVPGDSRLIGMSTTTVEGDLLTVRLDYSQGEDKPAFIQVVVGYRPPRAGRFNEGTIRGAIATAKRQMAPEFDVMGNAETIEDGLAFFFTVARTHTEGVADLGPSTKA
jgi:hypothetical protein